MSTAADLCLALENAFLGTRGTTLFAGNLTQLPGGPGPLTRVIEYGAATPDETHEDAGYALAKPRCQVTAHAAAYEIADAQARACLWELAGLRNAVFSGQRYLRVAPIGTPFDLGPDAGGRARVAFNVQVTRATA